MPTIKVLIVDDHRMFREGIRSRLEQEKGIKVVGEAASGKEDLELVPAMARLGIDGYMLKDAPQEHLVQAIRDIASGGVVLPPNIASKVMRSYAFPSGAVRERRNPLLTVRELEVLELLYQGFRNLQIAERLGISARTVENHVSSIADKLGAQSRTGALRPGV